MAPLVHRISRNTHGAEAKFSWDEEVNHDRDFPRGVAWQKTSQNLFTCLRPLDSCKHICNIFSLLNKLHKKDKNMKDGESLDDLYDLSPEEGTTSSCMPTSLVTLSHFKLAALMSLE
jgi:hypothetical protein